MKSTTRKLLLSLSTFLFALVALFGATFAWFTEADTATVDTLTFNVTAGQNLMISTTDVTDVTLGVYDDQVTSAQIATMYNLQHTTPGKLFGTNTYALADLRLTPLTSQDGKAFYVEQQGTLYADSGYAYTPGTAGIFYFDIVLTFRAEVPLNVYLAYDAALALITSSAPAEVGGAYRMAFIVGTSTVMIYEKDATSAKTNSFTRALNTHTQPTWTDVTAPVQTTTSALYDGSVGDSKTNSLLFSINPGAETYGYQLLTVRLWLEGWDIATADALKNSTVAVNLKFTGDPQ